MRQVKLDPSSCSNTVERKSSKARIWRSLQEIWPGFLLSLQNSQNERAHKLSRGSVGALRKRQKKELGGKRGGTPGTRRCGWKQIVPVRQRLHCAPGGWHLRLRPTAIPPAHAVRPPTAVATTHKIITMHHIIFAEEHAAIHLSHTGPCLVTTSSSTCGPACCHEKFTQ